MRRHVKSMRRTLLALIRRHQRLLFTRTLFTKNNILIIIRNQLNVKHRGAQFNTTFIVTSVLPTMCSLSVRILCVQRLELTNACW